MPSQSPSSSRSLPDPEYIAIILAATQGARLFPLTSEFPSGVPKHLLPLLPLRPSDDDHGGTVGSGKEGEVEGRRKEDNKPSGSADDDGTAANDGVGGCPLLERLLSKCHDTGLEMVVVAIHQEDVMTVPFLLTGTLDGSGKRGVCRRLLGKEQLELLVADSCRWHPSPSSSSSSSAGGDEIVDLIYPSSQGGGAASRKQTPDRSKTGGMHVRVVRLPSDCHGSADALRYLSRPPSDGGKKANDADGKKESVEGVGGSNKENDDDNNSNDNNNSINNMPENTNTNRNDNRRGRIIPATSNAIVVPGDLITEGQLLPCSGDERDVLGLLVDAHRRWNVGSGTGGICGENIAGSELDGGNAACTMLLSDVGAEDKNGVPLTRGSRTGMGLLTHEEEDMEYIGLSSEIPPPLSASLASLSFSRKSCSTSVSKSISKKEDSVGNKHNKNNNNSKNEEGQEVVKSKSILMPSRRVVLKRSKIEVEEDEGTGSTPKLTIHKRRLHASKSRRSKTNNSNSRRANPLGLPSGNALAMASTSSIDQSPTLSLRTDLHDLHLYVISNWVFQLIQARPSMASFQKEVLPLLISRQYRGVEGAFGPTAWKSEENRERLRKVLNEMDGTIPLTSSDKENPPSKNANGDEYHKISNLLRMYSAAKTGGSLGFTDDDDPADLHAPTTPAGMDGNSTAHSSLLASPSFPATIHPYVVSAQVLSRESSKLTLRACTIPSLLHGCREITSHTLQLDSRRSAPLVPPGAKLSTKFHSIVLAGGSIGEKVQTKSCTIGKNVVLGDRCKLNNVVVMDGAEIGENTQLQNSVVGARAKVGADCSLKNCQVGPGAVVPSGTKVAERGDAFHV
ncbi:hypothetical protein ACHAXS_014297 [Conticribra weissflogii]